MVFYHPTHRFCFKKISCSVTVDDIKKIFIKHGYILSYKEHDKGDPCNCYYSLYSAKNKEKTPLHVSYGEKRCVLWFNALPDGGVANVNDIVKSFIDDDWIHYLMPITNYSER